MKLNIRWLDWFFVLPVLAGITLVAEIDPPRDVKLVINGWVQGGMLLSATLLISLMVAITAAIDRRCSEEYAFQILANAALVAFASTMFVNLLWGIGAKVFELPEISAENLVGVMTLSLVFSYYWFRVKGIAQ
ncbi:MAG: hypothetical protein AAGI28_02170 [Pseudomonadota bacterium]